MCVCSPEYPLARYQSLSVEKLQKSGRVAACRPPVCPPPLFAAQSRVVTGRESGKILFCDNQEVLNLLVETGYAFAVAAAFPSNRTPDLCYIPMPEIEPLSFGAVYLTSTKNPQLNRFLDLLEESLQAPANDEKRRLQNDTNHKSRRVSFQRQRVSPHGKRSERSRYANHVVFLRNPRGGKAEPLDEADMRAFSAFLKENNFAPAVAHAPYTMNPCSPNESTRQFAREMFADDMRRMEYIPGNYYNFHPGSRLQTPLKTAAAQIADMLNAVLTPETGTTVLLETMAGKGSEVGRTFSNSAKFWRR